MLFKIEDVVLNEYKKRSIPLSLTSGKQLKFELPILKIPFGVSESRWDNGPPKFDIQFTVDQDGELYKWINDLETLIIDSIAKDTETIFNKNFTREEIQDMFSSNMRENTYNPLLRIKMNTKWESDPPIYTCGIFNNEGEIIDTIAKKGQYKHMDARAIVIIQSVYFMQGRFGLVWKLDQMIVKEAEKHDTLDSEEYQFLD